MIRMLCHEKAMIMDEKTRMSYDGQPGSLLFCNLFNACIAFCPIPRISSCLNFVCCALSSAPVPARHELITISCVRLMYSVNLGNHNSAFAVDMSVSALRDIAMTRNIFVLMLGAFSTVHARRFCYCALLYASSSVVK